MGLFKKHIGSISVFSNYAYGHWNPKIVSSSSSSSVVITYFPAKRSPEVLHDINAKVSPLAYSRFFLSIRFWMIFTWVTTFHTADYQSQNFLSWFVYKKAVQILNSENFSHSIYQRSTPTTQFYKIWENKYNFGKSCWLSCLNI